MGTIVARGRRPRARARAAGLIAVLAGTSLVVSANAGAQEDDPPDLTATQLSPSGQISGGKSMTSRLAETDPALLGRTDAAPVEVVVKLDYDAIATYQGSVQGLDATSPAVTGQDLDADSADVQAYESFVVDIEDAFLDQLAVAVPTAQVGQSLRTVYGGIALTIPANQVDDVLTIPEVVAVQADKLNQPLTDSSADFIGATSVYPAARRHQPGRRGRHLRRARHRRVAGASVVRRPGQPRRTAGQGRRHGAHLRLRRQPVDAGSRHVRLQQQADRRHRRSSTAYLSDPGRAAAEPYHTARDSNGHGTHTGSTSGGNALDSATVFGVERGPINGIAPGAWVSVYKVCGIEGCFDSDSSAAVGQAIEDGVDVINFSISGGTDPFTDPTELAFLDAYAAGVFVAASGGNAGPGAGTVNHVSPWVTTVAASTQQREFASDLSLTAGNGDTLELSRRVDHRRCRSGAPGRAVVGSRRTRTTCATHRLHPGRSPARSSPASAASTLASRRASTSSRAAPRG